MNIVRSSVSAALLALPAVACAHHIHVTVDTTSGTSGDAIVIRAGYSPSESAFSISPDGRLLDDGEIAVFGVSEILDQPGTYDGWAIHNPLSLTSDFYFATGRLDGGDFRFEIADVIAVSGDAAQVAWGVLPTATFQAEAMSWGTTRDARSFNVGVGSHRHGQYIGVARKGVYDLKLIAWDANGVYADSEPVLVRVTSLPAFCPADLSMDGVVDFGDYLEFLNLFDTGDDRVDFNHDGVVDFADYLDFLNLFDAGC